MNIEKLDKIILTKEDASKIMAWDKEHHSEYDGMTFPLTEGVIELEDVFEPTNVTVTTLTYFKITEDYILFRQFDKADMEEMFSFKIAGDKGDEFTDMKSYIKGATLKVMNEQARMTTFLMFCVFQYMANVSKNVVEHKISKVIKKKQKGKKAFSNTKNKITRISTTKYTFDFSNKETSNYERHAHAWTVRGHYRQLKSGKRVWIKPYVKGDVNEEIQPKEYKI
ncbi:hypothetical protein [Priestia megaterium]|uniref:hypothetical protein n=1 Tax=Priestia megaterium TaxID=1404 RepID=UPI000BFB1259|nr:hypothetical protein [Priestia megaterium]PGO60643.1 hypothetical protein CN981_08830 [Priestia megaterium]